VYTRVQYDIQSFTDHINSIDENIKFTMEEETNGSLAFLDTKVILKDDGTLKTAVYRKPTHTDQYLSFSSNHHISHKRSVVRSLLRRVDTIVSEPEDQELERTHVKAILRDNGYEEWMLDIPPPQPKTNTTDQTTPKVDRPKTFPIPYIHGMAENIAKIFKKYGVGTYHKPYNTLRSQLVRPKDQTPNSKKCGVIYEL
jgi:hypothetical protein